MLDLGHPVTFNEYVGDTDENGQRVDRQFRYYPHAEPPVLVTDGGAGGSEEAMQEESIAYGEDGIAITADTQHELLAFYWQATEKFRTFHDKVARGEIEPANTPDGNPPREEMQEETPPPSMNGNHFTQESAQRRKSSDHDHRDGTLPRIPEMSPIETPPTQSPPPGLPTVEVDIQTFTDMQRQLIVGEMQPLIDHQDMVIQSQCILLAKLLEPDSPHHEIMEMWMDKLEAMRLKVYGSTEAAEAAD